MRFVIYGVSGNKASATVQPFMVLHLDIVPEFVHSVEDALRMFAAPESLEGYKPATAKVVFKHFDQHCLMIFC